MGGHKGNFYVYYAHLLLPFLVFKVILIIENGIKVNSLRSIMNLFILFFCVFPFSRTYQIDFQARSVKMEQLWQLANGCTNIYEENPILAVYKLEHSMSPIYHNGQNDKASLVDTKKTTVFGHLSVYSTEDYILQLEKWNARINQSLENKDFDCVFSSHIKVLEGYHKDGIVIKGIRNQDIVKFVPD